jgi:hypothetical protein
MAFFSEDSETLGMYTRLRQVLKKLNSELMQSLSRSSILESAKKLGLAEGNVLVFDNPEETSVLFDYCLYCSRMGGKTVSERYIERTPPLPQSDEMVVLRAMIDSFYSVFQVGQVYKGRGVSLYDFFRKNDVFLVDIGLSDTAVSDMPFAGGILPFADFHISAGALLPLFEKPVIEAVAPIMEKWRLHHPDMDRGKLSPGLEGSFSAQLIRAALRTGALENARYTGITE